MPVDYLTRARARTTPDPMRTPCSQRLELYLDPRLEEPPARSAGDAQGWNSYQSLVRQARSACASCPLLAECLYRAVVQNDIAGYVGCTTPQERQQIRAYLGVTVEPEDLDAAAGARGARRPVDHAEVLRARTAFPGDSLEMLAQRLGCSLSTVKRHLRRARARGLTTSRAAAEQGPAPTVESVFDAFEYVVERAHPRSA